MKTVKTKIVLSACAVVLGAAMFSSAQDADYSAMMKAAVATNGALQKSVTTDLSTTADNATRLKDAFAKIEAFWAKRGASDAVTFAENIEMDADDVHAAAIAGKQDDATAAAKKIAANCGGCHSAHRDKVADGSFTIK